MISLVLGGLLFIGTLWFLYDTFVNKSTFIGRIGMTKKIEKEVSEKLELEELDEIRRRENLEKQLEESRISNKRHQERLKEEKSRIQDENGEDIANLENDPIAEMRISATSSGK